MTFPLWFGGASFDGAGDDKPAPPRLRVVRDEEPVPTASSPNSLVARLRAGDVAAFDSIVLTYDAPLRRFAARLLRRDTVADDVVQDVFVWLWERRETLRPETTESALRAYLYRATHNRAVAVARHDRIEERLGGVVAVDDVVPGMGSVVPSPDDALHTAELATAVQAAVDALSPRVRAVALLRWHDGLSREEIASVLGVALPTVKNQLATAVRTLRETLREVADRRSRGE